MVALPNLSPGPAGSALELLVECRTDPSKRGKKHPITIHPDWSVTTPHDLDAERIAASFGGYASCVELVDSAVPAFRAGLGHLTRRTPIKLQGNWRSSRALVDRAECCRTRWFADLIDAATHLRSVIHMAEAHGAREWQVLSLLRAAEATWGSWDEPPAVCDRAESLVREVGGVRHLWRAGLHPDDIVDLASLASVVDEPLPVSYYLAMTHNTVGRSWFGSVLAHRPDADTAAWLATLEPADQNGTLDDWGVWLGLGLSRGATLAAVRAHIPASAAYELAEVMHWTPTDAAQQLSRWASAGCAPRPHHFLALSSYGADHSVPSVDAIDALCADAESVLGMEVQPYRWTDDRTDLGVMLAALGNRPDVLHALDRGITSLAQLHAYVDRGEVSA